MAREKGVQHCVAFEFCLPLCQYEEAETSESAELFSLCTADSSNSSLACVRSKLRGRRALKCCISCLCKFNAV